MLDSIFKLSAVKWLPIAFCLTIFSEISRASGDTPTNCLSRSDAEKILGQTARLTENSTISKGETLRYEFTYTGISRDPETGKKENLFCLLEKYKHTSSAQNVFATIIAQNQGNHKIERLKQTGDEAIFLSDHSNYHLVIVRKDNKIFRLKVNKVIRLTSVEELKKVAKDIALKL